MKQYTVRFKNAAPTAASVTLNADNEADALREAARMLGMDTDPFTQTYTLALEAIPASITTDQHLAWCAAWNRAIVAKCRPIEALRQAQAAAAAVTTTTT